MLYLSNLTNVADLRIMKNSNTTLTVIRELKAYGQTP